jgi:hypothetical protein
MRSAAEAKKKKVKAGEARFRRLALELASAIESAHMGHTDFRVAKGKKTRIFATLSGLDKGYGVVMLTAEQQQEFSLELPEIFAPVPGGWGRGGSTMMRLVADEETMRGALTTAHENAERKL